MLRRIAIRCALVVSLVVGGLTAVASPASAAGTCGFFVPLSPALYAKVQCRRLTGDPHLMYRAWVECFGGVTYFYVSGLWQYRIAPDETYGPWSVATCPAGSSRTGYWYELRIYIP